MAFTSILQVAGGKGSGYTKIRWIACPLNEILANHNASKDSHTYGYDN